VASSSLGFSDPPRVLWSWSSFFFPSKGGISGSTKQQHKTAAQSGSHGHNHGKYVKQSATSRNVRRPSSDHSSLPPSLVCSVSRRWAEAAKKTRAQRPLYTAKPPPGMKTHDEAEFARLLAVFSFYAVGVT